MAATLATDGALSFWDATALWRLLEPRGRAIHVTVFTAHRRRCAGIVAHRTGWQEAAHLTTCDGIPVTTIPRTLLDIAAVASRAVLVRAVKEAWVRHRTSDQALARIVEQAGRRPGARALGAVIGLRARSGAEVALLDLCKRAKLPGPIVNGRVHGMEVDAHWPHARLAVEVDGRLYHRSAAAIEADRRREAALAIAGWTVLRFSDHQIAEAPDQVSAALRTALSVRGVLQ
jgi:very-short-patch-repair endonuclease